MNSLSRRDFVSTCVAASAALPDLRLCAADPTKTDLHQQILDRAADLEKKRRARFSAVKSKTELESLQKSLRATFLRLLDGLPEAKGAPPVRKTGKIEADDYIVEKFVYESLPGYFVSALLYKPKKIEVPIPGVISPCGHSATGKAADSYQILHINLVRRGYVVLTYDPVGQAERSQFWDAQQGKSRFNLVCGEHAVLGNPLYLLGTSLARYRIFDGMRGIDYLASLADVDPKRIGCVGNSGGGTLSAYLTALDPRIAVAAICCYITTLPRRMGNRIEADPDSDPEQDIFGFVGEGIDHAGLLALCAPRPVLLGTARFDFFPIEGARESFDDAKNLYKAADAADRIERAEAAEKHGLTPPLRKAVYRWFDRWLAKRDGETPDEFADKPRPAKDLLVCAEGQVNRTFQSRPLLPLALEEFRKRQQQPRIPLRDLLRLELNSADFAVDEIHALARKEQTLVVCINGNEARNWQEEKSFLDALGKAGFAVAAIDPRGVGKLRPNKSIRGRDYADPLAGVEENIAYNAFLIGQSLLGMRVADVMAAIRKLTSKVQPKQVVLCGRRDAGLVASFTAAVEPAVSRIALEEMLLSFTSLFSAAGVAINAASILPGMLRNYGDVSDLFAAIAPRPVLVAKGVGALDRPQPSVKVEKDTFTEMPELLTKWLIG